MTEMLAPPKIIDRPTGTTSADPLLRGIFEPQSGAPVAALARHKLAIAVVAIVCAALGVGYGLSRRPVYTASATLQVGQVNPNSPGFYGYVQSAAALASAFSRAIDAEPVLDVGRQKLGFTPVAASGGLAGR